MRKDQVYAVVDIESTGGSIGTGERMIQFACVLLRNGEIVEKFDTYVNPLRQVPHRIQELTGILPRDLTGAPLFEDLAEFIYDLLEDTIFVAHNVAFDYKFLNEELVRAGLKPLCIPAIDTVELSQILFPTADSYNLQELADWLGYDLDRPHNALFDAEATAFVLQKLKKRVESLPLVTLERLVELSFYCTAETSLFFEHTLEEMKENPRDLPDDLIVVNGIALKDIYQTLKANRYRDLKEYPKSSEEKLSFFDEKILTREDQEEMMDYVYHYLIDKQPKEELAIEAAPGSGKSIGYLLPASFVGRPKAPIVVSTYTTVLQKQLIEQTLPVLNNLLPFDLNVTLIKSKKHYLSLAIFDEKLQTVKNTQLEAFFCMRILVWLTKTNTGDLEEMGTGGHNKHEFWDEIRTSFRSDVLNKEKWTDIDFYDRLQKQMKESSIIITNHSYLIHDLKNKEKTLPDFSHLIVDEAHHLPDVIQETATEELRMTLVKDLCRKLGGQMVEGSYIYQLTKFVPKKLVKKYQLDSLEANRQFLEEEWDSFCEDWLVHLDIKSNNRILEWRDQEFFNQQLTGTLKKSLKQLKTTLEEILFVGNHIVEACLKEKDKLLLKEQIVLEQFYQLLREIDEMKQSLINLFESKGGARMCWVSYYTKQPLQTIQFQSISMQSTKSTLEQLHQKSHILYTSSTLSVNNNIRFFKERMGHEEIDFVSLTSPYHYDEQARVYVPEHLPDMLSINQQQYIAMLANYIEEIMKGLNENTLILFRSLETLQQVYRELSRKKSLNGREILAQNLSGTRTKLLRQFKKANKAILLGADSFWEGIDLPKEALRIVIITRLPFDSPDVPQVKIRHQQLEKQGKNSFMFDLLPKAVLRMRQGFGRLIRSSEDKGVFIILDSRFINSSYSKAFIDALPNGVKIDKLSVADIKKQIKIFLDNKKK